MFRAGFRASGDAPYCVRCSAGGVASGRPFFLFLPESDRGQDSIDAEEACCSGIREIGISEITFVFAHERNGKPIVRCSPSGLEYICDYRLGP